MTTKKPYLYSTILAFFEEEAAFGAPVSQLALLEAYGDRVGVMDTIHKLTKEGKIWVVAEVSGDTLYELRPQEEV